MTRLKTLTIILFCLLSGTLKSQEKMEVLLSNHSFSSGNMTVGTVHTNQDAVRSFKLKGKNAKLFTIVNNDLVIRPKGLKSDVKFYDLEIDAVTASGKTTGSFRIVHDQFARNKVIAHRGAWKNTGAAENSVLALQHAVRLGCQGSEFDVHMSADSVLVVNHDPTIQGLTIASTDSKQLTDLKLSSGENLPTLEAYLREGMKQNTTKLVLEIKPTTNKERAVQLARKVVSLVNQLKAQGWIDYISFDYTICREVQRLDPFARVAYLNGDKSPEELAADNMWGFDYHFNIFKKNEQWIEEAKSKNLTINAWTVNDGEMLRWFLDKKIDFITTNEPELLLKMVSR